MKRYVSFDFIKGIAIIGVLGFHLLNVLYDANAAIENDPSIPLMIIIIFFYYLGQFFGLFIMLSAIGNTISIRKQWDKIQDKDEETKNKMAYSIIKSQTIRGLLTILLGFISETFLNGLIINLLTDEEEILSKIVSSLYLSNIIQLIGFGTIFGALFYVNYLKSNENKISLAFRTLIISIVAIIINIILIETLPDIPGFDKYLGKNWEDRDILTNIGFFFLFPLIGRVFPIFPNILYVFIGVFLGDKLSSGTIPKKFFKNIIIFSLILTLIGVILSFIEIENTYYQLIFEIPLLLNGILIATFVMFFFVDYRGKAEKFAQKTSLIRKFGILTLTIWCLQWVMAAILRIVHEIQNSINNTDIAFTDSKFMTNGFTGMQFWGIYFLMMIMWSLIVMIWSKFDFKYSFEWFVIKGLSKNRPDAANRLKMEESITNVEGLYKDPELNADPKKGIYAILLFLVYDVIYVALTLL